MVEDHSEATKSFSPSPRSSRNLRKKKIFKRHFRSSTPDRTPEEEEQEVQDKQKEVEPEVTVEVTVEPQQKAQKTPSTSTSSNQKEDKSLLTETEEKKESTPERPTKVQAQAQVARVDRSRTPTSRFRRRKLSIDTSITSSPDTANQVEKGTGGNIVGSGNTGLGSASASGDITPKKLPPASPSRIHIRKRLQQRISSGATYNRTDKGDTTDSASVTSVHSVGTTNTGDELPPSNPETPERKGTNNADNDASPVHSTVSSSSSPTKQSSQSPARRRGVFRKLSMQKVHVKRGASPSPVRGRSESPKGSPRADNDANIKDALGHQQQAQHGAQEPRITSTPMQAQPVQTQSHPEPNISENSHHSITQDIDDASVPSEASQNNTLVDIEQNKGIKVSTPSTERSDRMHSNTASVLLADTNRINESDKDTLENTNQPDIRATQLKAPIRQKINDTINQETIHESKDEPMPVAPAHSMPPSSEPSYLNAEALNAYSIDLGRYSSETSATDAMPSSYPVLRYDDPPLEEMQSDVSVGSSGFDMRSIHDYPPQPPAAAMPKEHTIPEEGEDTENHDETFDSTWNTQTPLFANTPFDRNAKQQISADKNKKSDAFDMFETASWAPTVTDFSTGMPGAVDIEKVAADLLASQRKEEEEAAKRLSEEAEESRFVSRSSGSQQQQQQQSDNYHRNEAQPEQQMLLPLCIPPGEEEPKEEEIAGKSHSTNNDDDDATENTQNLRHIVQEQSLLHKVQTMKEQRPQKDSDECMDMFDTGSWANTEAAFSDLSLSNLADIHGTPDSNAVGSSPFLKMMKEDNEKMTIRKAVSSTSISSSSSVASADHGEEKKTDLQPKDDQPLLADADSSSHPQFDDVATSPYNYLLGPSMEERVKLYTAPNENDEESSSENEADQEELPKNDVEDEDLGGNDDDDDADMAVSYINQDSEDEDSGGDDDVVTSYISQDSEDEEFGGDGGDNDDDDVAISYISQDSEDEEELQIKDEAAYYATAHTLSESIVLSENRVATFEAAARAAVEAKTSAEQNASEEVQVGADNTPTNEDEACRDVKLWNSAEQPIAKSSRDFITPSQGSMADRLEDGTVSNTGVSSVFGDSVASSSLMGEYITGADSVHSDKHSHGAHSPLETKKKPFVIEEFGVMPPPPPPPRGEKKKKKKRRTRPQPKPEAPNFPRIAPPSAEKLKMWEESKMRGQNHLAKVKARQEEELEAETFPMHGDPSFSNEHDQEEAAHDFVGVTETAAAQVDEPELSEWTTISEIVDDEIVVVPKHDQDISDNDVPFLFHDTDPTLIGMMGEEKASEISLSSVDIARAKVLQNALERVRSGSPLGREPRPQPSASLLENSNNTSSEQEETEDDKTDWETLMKKLSDGSSSVPITRSRSELESLLPMAAPAISIDQETADEIELDPVVCEPPIVQRTSLLGDADVARDELNWSGLSRNPPKLFSNTASPTKAFKKADSTRSPTHISTILPDQRMAERVAVASSAAAVKLEQELASGESYSLSPRREFNQSSNHTNAHNSDEDAGSPFGVSGVQMEFCSQDTTMGGSPTKANSSPMNSFFMQNAGACGPISMEMDMSMDAVRETSIHKSDNSLPGGNPLNRGAFTGWRYPDVTLSPSKKRSENLQNANNGFVGEHDDIVAWLCKEVLATIDEPLPNDSSDERFERARSLLETDGHFNAMCQYMTDAVNTTTNDIVEAGTFEDIANMETDDSTLKTDGSNLDDHVAHVLREKRPKLRPLMLNTVTNGPSSKLLAANFVSFLYLASRLSKVPSPFGSQNPFLQDIVDMSLRKAEGESPETDKDIAEQKKSVQQLIFDHPDGSVERVIQFMYEVCLACETDATSVASDYDKNAKLLIGTYASDMQNGKKTPRSNNRRISALYIVPDEQPSPFYRSVLEAPRILIAVLDYLGDPVAVCRMKMVNRFSKRIVTENEHVLMRDAVRAGGMSMNVRPAFWMWITLYKCDKGEDGDGRVDLEELARQGEEGRWSHIIERDVARSFGNMPPHKTGARLRTDSIVRALVTWGRNRIMSRGVRGGGDGAPMSTIGLDGKVQKERSRRSMGVPPWENGDEGFGKSEINQTPTDTVSDWGGVSPVGSFSGSLPGMRDDSLLDKSSQRFTPAEDLALSGNAFTEDMKEDMKKKLGFILHALAAAHGDVGYCQGMDYVIAHLLRVLQDTIQWNCIQGNLLPVIQRATGLPDLETYGFGPDGYMKMKEEIDRHLVLEETIFRVMDTLFTTYNLRHMYWPELRYLKICCRVFERLIQIKLPVLADHFEHHELNVGLFALGWFQTLFLYLPSMPSATVCHMWDIWLVERSFKIFFRVGTAILFLSQPILLNHELEGMMTYLNTFPDATLLNPDILIACALNIKVTNTMLAELEAEVTSNG